MLENNKKAAREQEISASICCTYKTEADGEAGASDKQRLQDGSRLAENTCLAPFYLNCKAFLPMTEQQKLQKHVPAENMLPPHSKPRQPTGSC